MRRVALAAVLASLSWVAESGIADAAHAASRWTFCVAATNGGSDVWISEVFAADGGRERIEGAFKTAIERIGGSGADAQCPNPRVDKTVAINAQIDAEAFNRKMGANLHALAASDFPGKR
jgi:hypothetical protein